jgi:hypothetical protein
MPSHYGAPRQRLKTSRSGGFDALAEGGASPMGQKSGQTSNFSTILKFTSIKILMIVFIHLKIKSLSIELSISQRSGKG